ncbi:MAG: type 1 glutamine amidotransferase [Verrucomicrobiae bacterium]|nr:type 1 glutamine amidotransferase [Verrucomicrobiae bacterium]NNJ87166.1 type 1 glutamine amidotransferase [Akkermansiaceae bacterium]
MQIICFKHVSFESPAAIADWAKSRGHNLRCVELHAGEIIPSVESYDMLVVMGGPMNIYQHAQYPWLTAEKAAIQSAIHAGKSVVGICLGAQLIADTLGSKIRRGPEVEIGWHSITRTSDCPDSLPLPDTLRVYHWHGDTFDLPDGAVHIASSAACASQVFLYQGRVLGLQCHLETTRESMQALIATCGDEICEGPYIQSVAKMQSEADATFQTMQQVLFQLLDHITADA